MSEGVKHKVLTIFTPRQRGSIGGKLYNNSTQGGYINQSKKCFDKHFAAFHHKNNAVRQIIRCFLYKYITTTENRIL